ncbi:hypothetical protein BDY21DRAFT_32039 [Lineolata rhizophorae]|uniref:Uncharacterized protein n=1 Tax=Lineolata rhizophorae TaxID=578093 RepID=A0A6A6NZ41_9PEZI|nr:hypothetical protein BDY21DRAFT_32039 [Lineolata rhizophorae]
MTKPSRDTSRKKRHASQRVQFADPIASSSQTRQQMPSYHANMENALEGPAWGNQYKGIVIDLTRHAKARPYPFPHFVPETLHLQGIPWNKLRRKGWPLPAPVQVFSFGREQSTIDLDIWFKTIPPTLVRVDSRWLSGYLPFFGHIRLPQLEAYGSHRHVYPVYSMLASVLDDQKLTVEPTENWDPRTDRSTHQNTEHMVHAFVDYLRLIQSGEADLTRLPVLTAVVEYHFKDLDSLITFVRSVARNHPFDLTMAVAGDPVGYLKMSRRLGLLDVFQEAFTHVVGQAVVSNDLGRFLARLESDKLKKAVSSECHQVSALIHDALAALTPMASGDGLLSASASPNPQEHSVEVTVISRHVTEALDAFSPHVESGALFLAVASHPYLTRDDVLAHYEADSTVHPRCHYHDGFGRAYDPEGYFITKRSKPCAGLIHSLAHDLVRVRDEIAPVLENRTRLVPLDKWSARATDYTWADVVDTDRDDRASWTAPRRRGSGGGAGERSRGRWSAGRLTTWTAAGSDRTIDIRYPLCGWIRKSEAQKLLLSRR